MAATRSRANTSPAPVLWRAAVMQDRAPLLIADASNDPRASHDGWPEDLGPALFVPLPPRRNPRHSRHRESARGADVPSRRCDTHEGILCARNGCHSRLPCATAAATAWNSWKIAERVALAMTDGVIGRISSTSLTLHTALSASLPDPVADRLRDAVDELDATSHSIRDAVFPR